MREFDGYGDAEVANTVSGGIDNPDRATYIQRCDQRIKDAETTLKRYKRIKELLSKHPDLEEILTLVGRVKI